MRVLVIAPHPDDDAIGCGGSIVQHVRRGDTVHIIYVTSGEHGSPVYEPSELAKIREDEAAKGAQILGAQQTTFLRQPDGNVGYSIDLVNHFIQLIRTEKPDVLYLPHSADGHKDHQQTFQIVMEAVGRAQGNSFPEWGGKAWNIETILGYEVWTPLTHFQYVNDISDVIEVKLNALREHRSQLANVQYDDAVRSLNRFRGIMTERGAYCECFEVLKVTRLF
ncbi:MAG TPA: PIG-L deacetylase family protein [Oceanobacillus sp.]|nr:PIG-L deacetylase family protein [Oceanobacillus sp.]